MKPCIAGLLVFIQITQSIAFASNPDRYTKLAAQFSPEIQSTVRFIVEHYEARFNKMSTEKQLKIVDRSILRLQRSQIRIAKKTDEKFKKRQIRMYNFVTGLASNEEDSDQNNEQGSDHELLTASDEEKELYNESTASMPQFSKTQQFTPITRSSALAGIAKNLKILEDYKASLARKMERGPSRFIAQDTSDIVFVALGAVFMALGIILITLGCLSLISPPDGIAIGAIAGVVGFIFFFIGMADMTS